MSDDDSDLADLNHELLHYMLARGVDYSDVIKFTFPGSSGMLHQSAEYWYWQYIRCRYGYEIYRARKVNRISAPDGQPSTSITVGCISCNQVYKIRISECGCGYSMLLAKDPSSNFRKKLWKLHRFWTLGIIDDRTHTNYLLQFDPRLEKL